ncbi:sodium- and chloride-dependent GABA transporter 1 [Lingula anatina]|uniref:Sodium- and chloride-dependent GABA transporter 1 n=1 Tax=Lingula anatina TaxID=7574 RepID=A0A1S3JME7_LINAN|nr:sodium- and chloride-dependent GABA transporter 1 [Lingula anatina]XP_013411546.1 sodium- and chloride-dependent GABA transporter 1 [Lingula anatina]XP_013411547.1 sodium- and chloride-dependent GABA transporter 1 [Lingula anatina]XP_013411549.1 sodium- and chloride-dependent GABA transporter 1 [Lingula anatina]|eukprot:XP_013411545.1 sodium- and chloride-dependent GABA transporter 1 [Lingula anatina]
MAEFTTYWNPAQLALVCFYVFGYYNLAVAPYIIYRHASVMFWVAFALFLWFVLIPVMMLLMTMGAKTGRGIVGMISKGFPLMKGAGIALLVLQAIQNLIMSLLSGHALFFMFDSLSSPYPWSTCDNPWNTECCGQPTPQPNRDFSSVDSFNFTTVHCSPGQESSMYFSHRILQSNSDGGVPWTTALPTLGVWVCVFLGSMGGAGVFGVIMYVVAPLYALFYFIVLIYGRTVAVPEEVTSTAMEYFYVLRPEVRMDVEEALRVFTYLIYSLGLFSGILPTLGKYTGRRCRQYKWLYYCFWIFPFIFVLVAPHISVGLVAPYVGGLAYKKQVSLDEVMVSGTVLLFQALPDAVAELDVPNGIAFLLFATIFLASIIPLTLTTVVILDNIQEGLGQRMENRPWLWRLGSSFVFCTVSFLFSLIFCSRGGYSGLFEVLDVAVVHLFFLFTLTCGIAVAISFFRLKYHLVIKICLGIWFLLAILITTCFQIIYMITNVSFLEFLDEKFGNYASAVSWALGIIVWLICMYAGAFHTICTSGSFSLSKICCPAVQDAYDVESPHVEMAPLTPEPDETPDKTGV